VQKAVEAQTPWAAVAAVDYTPVAIPLLFQAMAGMGKAVAPRAAAVAEPAGAQADIPALAAVEVVVLPREAAEAPAGAQVDIPVLAAVEVVVLPREAAEAPVDIPAPVLVQAPAQAPVLVQADGQLPGGVRERPVSGYLARF
jgi:hypothetical protein